MVRVPDFRTVNFRTVIKVVPMAAAMSATIIAGAALADDQAVSPNAGLAADIVVNGQPISVNHVKLMAGGLDVNSQGERVASPEDAQRAARAELITEEVLAQAAKKKGIDKRADVVDQLAYQQRAILSRAYLEDYFEQNPVNDATLKAAYEWKRANNKIVEYKVRQILVTSDAVGREVIAALNKGEDFASVAKKYTQDPGGQNNGGDLGWFRPDIFVDHHFTDEIESLKKGQYSKAPVRSRFGWHIVKIEDGPRVIAKPQPYEALDDSVREALRQRGAQQQIESLTTKLTAEAKVTGPGAAGSVNQKSAKR
ncbi:hypothetical protein WQQ_33630 [Hydrocarboniphaga effusa AP103]|uniref:peptidylprolyl isomerase n=2 Tax=Nevskiaceae TaxID=568386 RepID=I8I1W2_9GAMM|nr:hypothetical protein WQQ_33630 [Hydrocarboniphaga effusa AP103]